MSDAASRSHTSPLCKPTATVASKEAKAAIFAGARHSTASDDQTRLTAAASQRREALEAAASAGSAREMDGHSRRETNQGLQGTQERN